MCLELAAKISENDENAELLNFLGLLEDYKGNYKEACRYIQKAIKLDADNDKYFYNLANMYFKQGDTMYAKRYYNLAISLNPQNPNYHLLLRICTIQKNITKERWRNFRIIYLRQTCLK